MNDVTRGYKAKTIKTVIRKKVDSWLSSITDPQVKELAEANTIVTGGCIASMLLGEQVNDFDLYFTNRETTLAIAKYYVAQFKPKSRKGIECETWVDETGDQVKIIIKSAGIASEDGTEKPYQYFEGVPDESGAADGYVSDVMQSGEVDDVEPLGVEELAVAQEAGKPPYRPVFMSTNAITLSDKVQIVLRFYGDADEIHKNYDFVHCTNYWTSKDSALTLRQPALEALLARELRYVGSKYPICSLIRLRKFIRRGWTVNAGQVLKIAMQISDLDLSSHEVLKDQLTGVDVAYFTDLVSRLKDKDPEKVNAAYLVEIIDRMF